MTNTLVEPSEQAPEPAQSTPPVRRSIARRAMRGVGWIVLGFVVFVLTIWTALAVYFTDLPGGATPRPIAAAIVTIAMIASLFVVRPRRFRLIAFAAIFLLVLLWFFTRQPSNT